MTQFFALLALGADAVVLMTLVAAGVPRWRARLVEEAGRYVPGYRLLVAGVTMAGSLYLSEVRHFRPCTLCWYQRIALYPIVVLAVVALVRRDNRVGSYIVPLAGISAVVSIYHLLVERFPTIERGSCDPTNPCSIVWVRHFGFVSIPFMALSSAFLQLALVAVERWHRQTPIPGEPI